MTAADLPYGPAVSLSEDSMVRAVRSKILGPLFAAQQAAPRITTPGSITFTSGVAASRPAPGGALAATVNGLPKYICPGPLRPGKFRFCALITTCSGRVETPGPALIQAPQLGSMTCAPAL